MTRGKGRGRFIVLEGLDGAGTTTQVERLAAALRAHGHRVLTTRQPSDGPIGAQIRQALTGRLGLPGGRGPLTEDTLALMFAADRLDHLAAVVGPAVARGEIVLCDRYVLSSLAYQGSALPLRWVETINARATLPDLTLYLHVDLDVATRRRAQRGGDAELFEVDDRQRRIARQYAAAIRRRAGHERIVRIDGNRPADEVTREALEAIFRVVGLRTGAGTRRRKTGRGRRGEG